MSIFSDTHLTMLFFFITVGVVLWYGTVLIVAEVVRRICLLTEEILHLKTRYDNDLTQMLLQVFGTTSLTSYTMLTFLLFCFVSTKHLRFTRSQTTNHIPTWFRVGSCTRKS